MDRYLLLIAIALVGCSGSSRDTIGVRVSGTVLDSQNKIPIAGARITVLCWYHRPWDKLIT